jgi:hypothetical protein
MPLFRKLCEEVLDERDQMKKSWMKMERIFNKIEKKGPLVAYNIYYLIGHNQEERQDHRRDCQVKHGG